MAKPKKDQVQDDTKATQQAALDALREAQSKLVAAENVADTARIAYDEAKDNVKELALVRDRAKTAARKAGIDLPRSLADLDKVTL